MTSSDEHAVVVRAQAGDRAAVGELYTTYHGEIFRYLYYQVGDHHTAEDLAAEVFERMLKALPRYQQQGVAFQAWLFRIARNAAVDYFRKTNMRKLIPFDDTWHASEASPEASVEHSFTSERLAAALQKLRKNQRDVIILRFIVEMPIAEVGRVMGKPENAIKGLQRRALIALRDLLVDWNGPYDEAG
jgi:RNA polymerase sigma-70 factor (ECF subfamily)